MDRWMRNQKRGPKMGMSDTLTFDPAVTKLIQARVLIAKTDELAFDFLCDFQFAEGSRVATLARDRTKIVYNSAFVESASLGELGVMLKGIPARAM